MKYITKEAIMSKRNKPRLKGYYICAIPCCKEFISNIPLKQQKCPDCGRIANRVMYMNSLDVEGYKNRRQCDAVGAYYDGFN